MPQRPSSSLTAPVGRRPSRGEPRRSRLATWRGVGSVDREGAAAKEYQEVDGQYGDRQVAQIHRISRTGPAAEWAAVVPAWATPTAVTIRRTDASGWDLRSRPSPRRGGRDHADGAAVRGAGGPAGRRRLMWRYVAPQACFRCEFAFAYDTPVNGRPCRACLGRQSHRPRARVCGQGSGSRSPVRRQRHRPGPRPIHARPRRESG